MCASVMSLTATNSRSIWRSKAALNRFRPMRPKPLIPTLVGIDRSSVFLEFRDLLAARGRLESNLSTAAWLNPYGLGFGSGRTCGYCVVSPPNVCGAAWWHGGAVVTPLLRK